MRNVAFWKSGHPYLYIEVSGDDYSEDVCLTEHDVEQLLKYIFFSMPDVWEKAVGPEEEFEQEKEGEHS